MLTDSTASVRLKVEAVEMLGEGLPRRRRGVTAIETAIILVTFIIMAASFAFIVLNMGFIVS